MPKFDDGEYWLRSANMVCMPDTAWDRSALKEEVMSQAITMSQHRRRRSRRRLR